MKGWVKISIGVFVALVVLPMVWMILRPQEVARRSGARPVEPASTKDVPPRGSIELVPGVSAAWIASAPPDFELLCAKCYKPYPQLLMRVVPTWLEGNGYVGSYRCNVDAPSAIAETRERLTTADDEALKSFLRVVHGRVSDPARIAKLTAGETPRAGAMRLLDSIERGELVLKP